MKCQGCGHDYPSTITRCTRCGQLSPKRVQKSSQSRLIEFPRKPRTTVETETSQAQLPAWRVELNERVRAARAKRSQDEASAPSANELQPPDRFGDDLADRDIETADTAPRPRVLPVEDNRPPAQSRKGSNTIVEAALSRARRASENASRAALPKIEPARPVQHTPKTTLTLDREATARALEPDSDTATRPDPRPDTRPDTRPDPIPSPAVYREEHAQVKAAAPSPSPSVVPSVVPAAAQVTPQPKVESIPRPRTAVPVEKIAEVPCERDFSGPIDEIEPLDYLAAEIKKVDKALSAEFSKNESPTLFMHAVIWVVDLVVVTLSCAPFLAIANLMDATVSTQKNMFAGGVIILLVSFLYFAVTHWLAGRTFGMMVTNTRVVDFQTFEQPTANRGFLRAVGCLIATAPVMVGLLMAVFNRKHRGLQDILSGTMVVRDF